MAARKLLRYLMSVLRRLIAGRRHALGRLLAGSEEAVVDLPSHQARLLVNVADRIMSKSLLFTGTYEPHVTRVLLDLIRPDSRVLDIGANLGYFTVLAARHAPRGLVRSFEPDPGNFRMLSVNIALNGLQDRVEAHNLAVGDADSTVLLTNLEAGNAGGRLTVSEGATLERLFGKDFPRREVKSVRLDGFLGDAAVDLVKIDIEGFEPKAFAGMQGLLARRKPRILAEFAPANLRNIGGMEGRDLLASLLRHGYSLNAIEFETGRLLPYGSDIEAFLTYFGRHRWDHVDICLLPA
jgi:FkbM family methyltransferase